MQFKAFNAPAVMSLIKGMRTVGCFSLHYVVRLLQVQLQGLQGQIEYYRTRTFTNIPKKVLFILPNKQKTQRSTWGKHLFHWFWQVKVGQIHKLLWQMSQFVLQVYLGTYWKCNSFCTWNVLHKKNLQHSLLVVFFAAVHRQFMAFFSRKTF